MEYRQQEYDFVDRTRKILAQYDDYFRKKDVRFRYKGASVKLKGGKMCSSNKYDVTLLLNSMVGLIVLPKEFWYSQLPNEEINKERWGIDPLCISFISTRDNSNGGEISCRKSVRFVSQHLRNSLAHYKFEVFKNDTGEINQVGFRDYLNQRDQLTFDAIIAIDDLRMFADKLSSWFLQEMKRNHEGLG